MINIRPVSDLRNKYQEIENSVLKDNKNVYLTKNGYGAMVVMSLEQYSKMAEQLQLSKEQGKKNNNVNYEILDEISIENDKFEDEVSVSEEILPKIKRKM